MLLDKTFPPDVRVENEAAALSQAGHQVFLLCFSTQKKHPRIEEYRGFHIIRRYRSRRWIEFWTLTKGRRWSPYECFWRRAALELVRRFTIEALHVHDLYMMGAGEHIRQHCGLPVILDLHENYVAALKAYAWLKPGWMRLLTTVRQWEKLEERYLSSAQQILVLSDYFKAQLQTRYCGRLPDINVYPNVPDVDELLTYPINAQIYPKNNQFVLLYFGVIAERRGVFTCLEAVQKLIPRIPELRLLLIGRIDKRDRRRLRDLMTQPDLGKHVTHIPWIDVSQLPSWLAVSDVCLSPIIKNDQHESGVANKVFQYMLFAKPVIVSDCRPQQEIIVNEQCGLVFESQDAARLAESVMRLFNSPEMRHQMGMNGRQAVIHRYNQRVASQTLIHLYDQLPIGNNQRNAAC